MKNFNSLFSEYFYQFFFTGFNIIKLRNGLLTRVESFVEIVQRKKKKLAVDSKKVQYMKTS